MMLDRQGEAFAGQERLTAMTLGLAAVADRVASLLAIPRGDGQAVASEDQPLAFAILGVLSMRRTLWAALSTQPRRPAAPQESNAQAGVPRAGLLR